MLLISVFLWEYWQCLLASDSLICACRNFASNIVATVIAAVVFAVVVAVVVDADIADSDEVFAAVHEQQDDRIDKDDSQSTQHQVLVSQ